MGKRKFLTRDALDPIFVSATVQLIQRGKVVLKLRLTLRDPPGPRALKYKELRLTALCKFTQGCQSAWEGRPSINATTEVCSSMQTDSAVYIYIVLRTSIADNDSGRRASTLLCTFFVCYAGEYSGNWTKCNLHFGPWSKGKASCDTSPLRRVFCCVNAVQF